MQYQDKHMSQGITTVKKMVIPLIISWFACATSCLMASITISVVGISGICLSFLTGKGENQSEELSALTSNSVLLTYIGQLGPVFGCNIVEHSIQPLLNHLNNIPHTILLEIGTVKTGECLCQMLVLLAPQQHWITIKGGAF
jgi:hypothetical protein